MTLPTLPDLLRDAFQIVVIALILYYIYVFVRKGTRGAQILFGIGLIIVLGYLCISWFNLIELGVVFSTIGSTVLLAICILFQPELRRLFADMDIRKFSTSSLRNNPETALGTIVDTAEALSRQRIGALIAFERSESLAPYEVYGKALDVPIIQDLLVSIFYPKAPLHDGAVVIRDGRIASAGCVFPVAMGQDGHHNYGTRHRAAIGLTEETDALVVVVSEETGAISVAHHGNLERGLTAQQLRERLDEEFQSPAKAASSVKPVSAEVAK